MRSKLTTAAVMLVAVFAISVAVASSASAAGLPAFTTGKCNKLATKTGWFTSSACVKGAENEKQEGEFELEAPTKKRFTMTTGAIEFETASREIGTCQRGSSVGEITGPRTGTLTSVYEECHLGPFASCGTIVTKPLLSKPVYLNEAHTTVGWAIEPKVKGGPFAEFSCKFAGVTIKVTLGVHTPGAGGMDSLLGDILPKNAKASHFFVGYNCNKVKQEPSGYWEGGKPTFGFLESNFQAGEWGPFCFRYEAVATPEEEAELRA
jgi:hypothetical protein